MKGCRFTYELGFGSHHTMKSVRTYMGAVTGVPGVAEVATVGVKGFRLV